MLKSYRLTAACSSVSDPVHKTVSVCLVLYKWFEAEWSVS